MKAAQLAGTHAELLFEGFTESGVSAVTGCQGDLRNIHGAHEQFLSGTYQPHPADVGGDAFPGAGREDSMQVRYRKAGNCGQDFTIERLGHVVEDVPLHIADALMMTSPVSRVQDHDPIVTFENSRSLFQMYHFIERQQNSR